MGFCHNIDSVQIFLFKTNNIFFVLSPTIIFMKMKTTIINFNHVNLMLYLVFLMQEYLLPLERTGERSEHSQWDYSGSLGLDGNHFNLKSEKR